MAIKSTLVTDPNVIKAIYERVSSFDRDELLAHLMVKTLFVNPSGGYLTWDDLQCSNEAFLYSVILEYSNRIGTVTSSIFGTVTNPEQKALTSEVNLIIYLLYTKIHARLDKAKSAEQKAALQRKLAVLQEVDLDQQTQDLKALSAEERAAQIAQLKTELNQI